MARIVVLMLSVFLLLTAFRTENKNTLKVTVTGFETKSSTNIWVSVFSETDFLKKSLQTKSVKAKGDKITVEFELPPGEYAVSTYHDLNNNDELDRYFFGKPKEPYGFSNNVKPLGPPSFDKCKFKIDNSPKTVSIELID